MQNSTKDSIKNITDQQVSQFYEPPAIIFEGKISTRAGSPIIEPDAPQPPENDRGIDLFPTD